MVFSSVRIITRDVKRLVEFYQQITGKALTHYTADFAELRTASANLAIGGISTLAPFGGPAVAKAAENHSAIIEFRVDNVDADYERLAQLLSDRVVQRRQLCPGEIVRSCSGTRMGI